ncbi:recombinase family protein [Vagococcus sp. BWB3-3]|uniref:Recombinase family protein n=1 Tax=Vagococcus allomyrinae TaxID=2794353 RepID=A0A940PIK5_9ENTE|nr:recombinase family protein [Vagococcus allomyrinae]MBP1044241.1 recombinase family protein [Vagococcus allomyrinae]
MSVYGYIRKEYPLPTVKQVDELSRCEFEFDELYIEEHDLKSYKELEQLLKSVKPGDHVVVCNLNVFSKGMAEFKQLLMLLSEQGIRLTSLLEDIDTERSPNFYSDVIKVLEIEEQHRRFIIKTSLEKAKLAGKITGRPKIDKQVINEINFLFKHKGKTMREIADICHVSLGTVHKYVSNNETNDKNEVSSIVK